LRERETRKLAKREKQEEIEWDKEKKQKNTLQKFFIIQKKKGYFSNDSIITKSPFFL
jgi:hypothetical protein